MRVNCVNLLLTCVIPLRSLFVLPLPQQKNRFYFTSLPHTLVSPYTVGSSTPKLDLVRSFIAPTGLTIYLGLVDLLDN